MVKRIKEINPPRGLARLGFRFPILLYRLGLGGLLGTRFLLLTHTGRKSGLARKTVLEVVRYDENNHHFIVAVGFGPKSDWFKNIKANPNVEIKSRPGCWRMKSNLLSSERCGEEMVDYYRRHPMAANELARFMGFSIENTEEDVRKMGENLNMVEFIPENNDNE